MRNNSNPSGCGRIIVIIVFIASVLTIFTFLTGILNFPQIAGWFFTQKPKISSTPSYQATSTLVNYSIMTPSASSDTSHINGNWTFSGLQGETASLIATGKGHVVYIGTSRNSHGVFESIDDGESWQAKNNGLGELDIDHLVIAPDNPDMVIATSRNFIWISTDSGKSWTPTLPDSSFQQNYPVAFGSRDGKWLFAAEQYISIYESKDSGKTWDLITRNFGQCNYLYSVLYTGTLYCLCPQYNTISRSNDKGKTWWNAASVGAQYNLTTMAVDENNDSFVYAGTEQYGIYKSTDGGGSWTPINNTLPNQGNGLHVTSIIIDPTASNVVYIGVLEQGVYRSNDGGESWELLTSGLAPDIAGKVLALGISQDSPRYLFAGTDGSGVFRYRLP